jgi:hypothetical protein
MVMTYATTLTYLRHLSGPEQALACLNAMSSSFHAGEPACEIIDAAIEQLEKHLDKADDEMARAEREEALWAADDAQCKRAAAANNALIPHFISKAI